MKGVNEIVEKKEMDSGILVWIIIIVVAAMFIAEFLISLIP
jgi:hypothetical protein